MFIQRSIVAMTLLSPVILLADKIDANDQNITQLTAVSVSATNFKETLVDDISKPVSVVMKEEILTKAPTSIIEVLKDTPGVSFSRAGGLGGQLVMRGFNSNDLKIPLTINGERLRGRGILEYNTIDPSRVEKVEIIRGPAAALYGSEAMAGTVNVVMKKPEPNFSDQFTVDALINNIAYESVNDMFTTRWEVQGGGKGFDMLIGASYTDAEDYETPNGKAVNSDFTTKHVDGTLGYSFDKQNRIEMNFKLSDTYTNRAGGLGSAPGMDAPQAQKVYLREDPDRERYVGLVYTGKPNNDFIDKIDASIYARKLWTDVVTTKYPNTTSVSETHRYVVGPLMYGGKAYVTSSVLDDTILTGGIDFYLQDWKGAEQETIGTGTVSSVARKKVESDSTQNNGAAFLIAEYEPTEWLILSANVRYDYYQTKTEADVITIPALTAKIQENKNQSDDIITYALGTVVKPMSWLHFAANYGTTYRTPTVNELFGYGVFGTGYLLPNPELKAEKGSTIDLSARLRFSDLSANVTVYQSKYTDMISYETLTYLGLPSRQRVNIGEAEVEGIELDTQYRLTDTITLKGNCAYTKATDVTTTDKPLKYIAPFVANIGIRYDNDMFYVEGEGRYSRDKDRIDVTAERASEGYTVYDIYAGMEMKYLIPSLDKTTFRVGIENLFDKVYRDATTQEAITSAISDTNPLIEPGRNFKFAFTTRF